MTQTRGTFARVIFGVLAATATIALVTACSGSPEASPSAGGDASGGMYRIPLPVPEGEIDPVTASGYGTMLLAGLASDGLVSLNKEGDLVGHLAESWTESEDQLSWSVQLREGASFNDGTPVTAADVVASFERLIAEDSVSPGKGAFVGVLEKITAEGDSTAVFHIAAPFADFPRLLTGTNTFILPADYQPGSWLENPIGAGQFVLDEYTVGRSAVYSKNPNYWDADNVALDVVEVKFYADLQGITLAYQAGEVDQIQASPEVKAAIDTAESRIQDLGYSQFNGLFMNTQVAPFDDPTVREAIAYTLDRERIVEVVHGGDAEVFNDNVFLPDYPVQPEGLEQREHNPDKVAELLGGRTISFTLTTSLSDLGQVIQQQLNATDGFEVELEVLTTGQYYAEGDDTPWLNAPVTLTTWAAGRLPTQYVNLLYGADSDWNASHYTNPKLEELAAEFDTTSDEAKRQELANQIGQIIHDDVPAVIPEVLLYRTFVGPRVQGEFAAALDYYGGYDLRGISVTE